MGFLLLLLLFVSTIAAFSVARQVATPPTLTASSSVLFQMECLLIVTKIRSQLLGFLTQYNAIDNSRQAHSSLHIEWIASVALPKNLFNHQLQSLFFKYLVCFVNVQLILKT